MRRLPRRKDSGRFQSCLVAESSLMRTPLICFPSSPMTGGVVGLPNGGTDNSGDLNRYLNIGSLNNNSLVNIAGIEGKYFLSDNWDVNFQFSMNVSLTPKKDYVEGDNSVPDMIIPCAKLYQCADD